MFKFDKMCSKVLKGLKVGDLISIADLHQRLITSMGFTKAITRANILRNMEKAEVITMKGLGMFEVLKEFKIDPYEVE